MRPARRPVRRASTFFVGPSDGHAGASGDGANTGRSALEVIMQAALGARAVTGAALSNQSGAAILGTSSWQPPGAGPANNDVAAADEDGSTSAQLLHRWATMGSLSLSDLHCVEGKIRGSRCIDQQ